MDESEKFAVCESEGEGQGVSHRNPGYLQSLQSRCVELIRSHIIPRNDVFSSHKCGHCIAEQGFVVQCCEVIYKTHVFKAVHQGIEAAKLLIITRPEADLTGKNTSLPQETFCSKALAINNFSSSAVKSSTGASRLGFTLPC